MEEKNIFTEPVSESAPVAGAETNHVTDAENETSSRPARKRRTKAEMEAERHAEEEIIRSRLLDELRERGLILDEAELEGDLSRTALAKLPFNAVLRKIQMELNVNKNSVNRDAEGNEYRYRTVDEILRVAKPLCAKYGCHVEFDSRVEFHSDSFCYIVVDAALVRDETDEKIVKTAYARESIYNKNDSMAQGTGACITYAKKYALDNLFALVDNSDDPDAKDNFPSGKTSQGGKKVETPSAPTTATEAPSTAAPASALPQLEKGTKRWNGTVTWLSTKADKELDELRAELSSKLSFDDETWNDLCKEAGR